jgi:uncharacterized protein YqjF (DUF2071 family)
MHQQWRHLLFVHWPAAPEAVERLLPQGLSLDTFAGRAYLGLVPFTVRGLRPPWLPPLPGLSSFHEVNLRTYVRLEGHEPGVFFFSLDAASRLAVIGARALYRLRYHFARIRLSIDRGGADRRRLHVRCSAARSWPGPVPARCELRYRTRDGRQAQARAGSLDEFLIERYVLYSESGGQLRKARVAHRPYPLEPAVLEDLDETLSAAAGVPGPSSMRLVHYSPGVSVRIGPPRRVGPARAR